MGRQIEQTKIILLLRVLRLSGLPFMIIARGVVLLRNILVKKQNLREDE